MGRFNFTGKLRYNTTDKKFSSYRSGTTKNGDKYSSVTLFVNSDDNNSGTVELMGMVQSEIVTKDNDGNDLTIDWDERKDSKIVESVAGYKKHVVTIGEDRETFIAPYDCVKFLWDNVEDLKGKNVTVTGTLKKNSYNGKVSDRFQIQNFYVVDDDKKKDLAIKEEAYFNKDSFDFSDFKEEKKIIVNAYTKEWMDREHPNCLVPRTYVIDCNKIDFNDEKLTKMFNARWMPIDLKYEKGKLTSGLKSNKYYCMMFDVRYKNGADEKPFDESMLTEMQRSQISVGLKTLEDFKPASRTFGNRVVEYKLVDCDLRGDYSDGKVTLDDTIEEIEDMIYQVVEDEKEEKSKGKKKGNGDDDDFGMNPPEEEKSKKIIEKKEEKKPESDEDEYDDSDLDDLFS